MSSITAPTKTQLGQDELRHRTRRLSQRERQALPVLVAERPTAEQAGDRTIRLLGTPLGPEPEVASMVPAARAPMPRVAGVPPAAVREPAPRVRPRPLAQLPVLDEVDEGAMLEQVREMLIATLRLDAPLFGARTFVRVRGASNAAELIELVWEIEQHLSHARH